MPKLAWVKNRAASVALGLSLTAGAPGAEPPAPGKPEPCAVATGTAEGTPAGVAGPAPEVVLFTPAGAIVPPPPPPHAASAASATVDSAAGAERCAAKNALDGGRMTLLGVADKLGSVFAAAGGTGRKMGEIFSFGM
jgi:hypothetical protein